MNKCVICGYGFIIALIAVCVISADLCVGVVITPQTADCRGEIVTVTVLDAIKIVLSATGICAFVYIGFRYALKTCGEHRDQTNQEEMNQK